MPILKERRTIASNLYGESFLSFDNGATRYPYQQRQLTGTHGAQQQILTENHPGFLAGLEGDQGGPFSSTKTEVEISSPKVKLGSSYYGYEGQLSLTGFYSSSGLIQGFPYSAPVDGVDRLFALGGTAVSRTLPTNPVGGAATFLGELRQGVPALIGGSLFRDRAKEALKAQKAGHEYLNVEFGWKPLIADLRKFALGVKKHDQIVSQLSRDSGRNVRRRYEFPAEDVVDYTDITTSPYLLGQADGTGLDTYIYAGPGTMRRVTTGSRKTWFSGCYTYHLPDYNEMYGVKRYLAEADKVLGVKITPEVLWNLAPWSWAADWFANTGDVLNNLTQFSQNDFAMRYGYLMQKRHLTGMHYCTQNLNTWQWQPQSHTVIVKQSAVSMVRVPASPFGFGITASDFSPRQLAITTALGLSRLR